MARLAHPEYREMIKERADFLRSQFPRNLARLISLARYALDFGPCYLNPAGEPVSPWDKPSRALDFCRTCRSIRDKLDQIDAFDNLRYTEFVFDEESGAETDQVWEIEHSGYAVVSRLVGSDLIRYL